MQGWEAPSGRITEPLSQELSLSKVDTPAGHVLLWPQPLASFLKHPWSKGGPSSCQKFQGRQLQVGGAGGGLMGTCT